MKCPSCGRLHKRVMFEVDEVYFECKKCEVELVLSPEELLSELPRQQARLVYKQSEAAGPSTDSTHVAVGPQPSTMPLLLWVVLLLGLAGFGTINAVRGFTDGVIAPGVLVLLLDWLLLVPTAITVYLRRRVGYVLTCVLLGLSLFASLSRFVNPPGESDTERGGNILVAIGVGAVALWWLWWFARNFHLFSQAASDAEFAPSEYRPAT